MIRILQIVNIMDRAGIETMLMNYYRLVDRTKIQFDFLTHRPDAGAYDEEIERLGGKIYRAPRLYPQNYPAYFKFMKNFWAEHPEYKVVHSHIDSMSYLPLLTAKIAGVPVRIAHSHNTSIDKDYRYILKQLFRAMINDVATDRYACSGDAGKYLFGKLDYEVIYNAIDTTKFEYSKEKRNIKRREFQIEENYVIGCVGRFTAQKNHLFLLDVFEKIVRKDNNYKLLLIGSGELRDAIEERIKDKKLENNIVLLNNREDIADLYQAMDLFVFPSLYEGLGMVAVEAQISGLPCIVSRYVPKDAQISDNIQFIELDVDVWCDTILSIKDKKERKSVYSVDYDVTSAVASLQERYLNLNDRA